MAGDLCRNGQLMSDELVVGLDQPHIATSGKDKQRSSRDLLEALAAAIEGTNDEEVARLTVQFNTSYGDLLRSTEGEKPVQKENHRTGAEPIMIEPQRESGGARKRPQRNNDTSLDDVREVGLEREIRRGGGDTSPLPSDQSDVKEPKKKKKKKNSSKKKQPKDSDSSSSSDHSSDSSSSSEDSSSDDSSQVQDAELVYEITEFESADLPDLPDKWDKGFRKLRSYVPLTLFNTALLESLYDEEGENKSATKTSKLKSSLKNLERQLTYGDFIEMSDLEERYAREIYGLETYADYVAKHKKIVSDLKKTYNCWMIGLRYHLKVRTVIFRRRKLIKSKVKGKTILKDKVKIPNGLQPLVERQARHDADRAGDLQYVDNPYAPGGPKFGFNFATGRASVTASTNTLAVKNTDNTGSAAYNQRGKRAGSTQRPYGKRQPFTYPRFNRFGNNPSYHQGKPVVGLGK